MDKNGIINTSVNVVPLSDWKQDGKEFTDYLADDSRLKQRILDPMQVMVNDTNEILSKYHHEPYDETTKSNIRNDLRSLAIGWIAEKIMKDDFNINEFIEDIMRKVEANVIDR